jgi:hypothetical protein
MASVPALSVLLASIFINSPFGGPIAGFAYFLYTPTMFAHGRRAEKKRKELIEELSEMNEGEFANEAKKIPRGMLGGFGK